MHLNNGRGNAPHTNCACQGLAAAHRPYKATERAARRNFILHVINGALFALGDALTSTPLVMTAFFSQLTTSNLLIGLLSPLRDAGWFLPQFFLAPMVERTRRKINVYRAGTSVRMIAWIALVVCMFTIEDRATLLVASLFCLGLFSILAGFAGLPFIIITAKIIPPNRRGLVFGLRQFIGGGLGILAGGVVALLLGGNMGFQFPRNYAVLFGFAAVGYALSYTSLGFVHEEPDDVPARSTPIMTNLRQAWCHLGGDRHLRFAQTRWGGRLKSSLRVLALHYP